VESVEQDLLERDTLLRQVQLRLGEAQNQMKQIYDKGHKDRVFQTGDMVYVRLHPYRQHSMARRINMKLAAKFYGPYKIAKRVGEVAYKLELPQGSKIHPIFHVSLLKKQVGPSVKPSTSLPEIPSSHHKLQPQVILERRGTDNNKEVLIHWKGHSPTDATFERETIMQQQFAGFALEDKGNFEKGGMI
jgi:hypothetical protein